MHEASASTTVVLTCTSAPDMRRMNWAVVKEEVVRADSGRGLPGSSESSTTTVFQGGLIYPYGHFFTQERGILLKTKKKKGVQRVEFTGPDRWRSWGEAGGRHRNSQPRTSNVSSGTTDLRWDLSYQSERTDRKRVRKQKPRGRKGSKAYRGMPASLPASGAAGESS
jgi:hypothetical protein